MRGTSRLISGAALVLALGASAFAGALDELKSAAGSDLAGGGEFQAEIGVPRALPEWTVMVYMNGKNDLGGAGVANLNQMERVGSNGQLNIVAELGSLSECPRVCSRRYFVTADDSSKIRSKELRRFKQVDMGDWRHLAEFAKWARANYPARHYALIIWNHGSGWLTTKDAGLDKGVSYDDETGNHISTPELGYAMKEIGKVDILAFDACLMQMAEVLYEVRDYADYVVGSETGVPSMGFYYRGIMKAFSQPGKTSGELAAAMVSAYDDLYIGMIRQLNLSAIRVSELGPFMTAFDGWTRALLASGKKAEIKELASAAVSFMYKDNKDLYDFARLLAEAFPGEAVGARSKALMEAMAGGLVAANAAYDKNGDPDGRSKGLAIYLPGAGYNHKYDALAWARDTRWDEFLREMAGVTAAGGDACVRPADGATSADWQAFAACLVR